MHNTYTLTGDNSTNTNTPRSCETKLNNSNNNYYYGKLTLTSLVALAFICILIALFHAYARWAHRRRRSRDLLRPHADYLVFNFGPTAGNASRCRGLDRSVIKSLPTFFYDSAAHDPPLECAVCLSEFVDGESGRVLPKCDHRFHVDCIDMWFCYHSNCPLCRGPVRAVEVENHPVETTTRVGESGSEAGSSSGGSSELVSIAVEEVV